MKRRSFLAGATGAAVATLAVPAIAGTRREITMAMAWPEDFPGLGTSARRLVDGINEACDGSLTIALHGVGELVPVDRMLEAVGRGEVGMYHAAEYYWEDRSKAFNVFASVPFGMTPIETDTWLAKFGGQELWDELSARYHVKPLAAGNTGLQMGGWFNKPVESLDDLQGLRIRMAGLAAEVLEALGAQAVMLSGSDIVRALQSGDIDAAEWMGPWTDMALGLHEAAKYYYYPGFHEPGTQISVGINLDLWNALSPAEQEIIRMACRTESLRMLAEFDAFHSMALERFMRERREDVRPFPQEVLQAFGEASSEVVTASLQGDGLERRIFESFLDCRHYQLRWTKLAEDAFYTARRLPFPYNRSKLTATSAQTAEAGAQSHNAATGSIRPGVSGAPGFTDLPVRNPFPPFADR